MNFTKTTILALLLSTGAASADPVEGLWQTQPGDSGGFLHVDLSSCGDTICGVIRKAIDGKGQEVAGYEHLGKQMIWNMEAQGDGAYAGGKIWAPDRGKTYNSKMQLSGNQLNVKGCVFGVCRGQDWSRVQ